MGAIHMLSMKWLLIFAALIRSLVQSSASLRRKSFFHKCISIGSSHIITQQVHAGDLLANKANSPEQQ